MKLPSRAALYDAFLLDEKQVGAILRFVQRLDPGTRWLDAGCGTGRLLPAFSAAGLEADGIDVDTDYVARARERAPGARVEVCDFASLATGDLGPYDGVIVCNGPLGYLQTDETLGAALAGVAAVLRPGGTLVTDTPDFPWILDNYRLPPVERSRVEGLDIERRSRHRIDRPTARFTHIDTLIACKDGVEVDRRTETWAFAIRTADALVEAHARAGFTGIRRWQGWESEAPSAAATGPRVLLTAQR